ncbi:cysteine--tRNA ligase [Candidatus Roizmanbacteria bacterium]|nr:cysteine--tRNA ligase [Candidatus Roizmanbacteria bacterium]
MKLFNTLTRKLEEFKPIKPGHVSFYQCGPTVYWVQHIGNLRAMTCADLIRRSFSYLGYGVTMVRNYTDVGHLVSDQDEGEDKMEKGAKREGVPPREIADKYIGIFEQDTRDLNILEPSFKPRATEYITQMIEMVSELIEKKHAYVTEYAVYFDILTFPRYNELNHQKIDFNQKGLGKGTADDPAKKHFADFSIWFFKKGAHKNALQTWPSPWGEGFPGWHIECSAMSKSLLGNTIDVHMGGVEHVSVHHTNEIAQSEAANGVKFVNYWLHNEHLNVDDAKMAKSQGTGFTLSQIKEKGFGAMDLRYFFLQAHYRSKQNFTWEALSAAKEGYRRLKEQMVTLNKHAVIPSHFVIPALRIGGGIQSKTTSFKEQFSHFISTDFQIPQALALVWDVLKSDVNNTSKLEIILDFDKVLGLKLDEVHEDVIPQEIIDLAEKRKLSKSVKDFKTSDELRRQIEEKGYTVEDVKDGFHLKLKSL